MHRGLHRPEVEIVLVVHPPSLGYFGEGRHPRLAARLMSASPAPYKRVAVLIPVGRGRLNRLADLRPGVEALALITRSAATQASTFEWVKCRFGPRTSQIPSSGWRRI